MAPHLSFRHKFNVVAGGAVFLGLSLSLVMALYGTGKLGRESSNEIEAGLADASREYVTNYLAESAAQAALHLDHTAADLEVLASVAQWVVEDREDLGPALAALSRTGALVDRLVYNAQGHWYQNDPVEPATVAVWGYLLEPTGSPPAIRADVVEAVRRTALLDLLLPPFLRAGSDKLQMYYVGPEEAPFLRVAPWSNAAGEADKKYPGHNRKPFWDFFFPGLVDSWKLWVKFPDKFKGLRTQTTLTPLYEDAGGGGLVMTFFHPLWTRETRRFAGAVGVDLTLSQTVAAVRDVKLFKTGFAFLAQANGNVLAINDRGERALRLSHARTAGGAGVDLLGRFLKNSSDPVVAGLKLPHSDDGTYDLLPLGGEPHVVAMKRLPPFNVWSGSMGIEPEHWTLGFVVPRQEILASLGRSQQSIQAATLQIAYNQVAIASGTLLLVLLGISLLSRRMTASLAALSTAAAKITQKNYDVKVEVRSGDEVGQLGTAFNQMAAEIRQYTLNLERLVQERTGELEAANQQINALNQRLRAENVRLVAELDVAQRLQLMVLPQSRELRAVPGLDIAGCMRPAQEVGGDYYDVLQSEGATKIGIGDVTGHGLESGVLMIMVQTAVRTLVAAEEKDPERFLAIVNKVLYENIQRINLDRNVTLSLLDYRDGALLLTGQHEEVIVVRADGRLERVDTMALGFPVGLEFDIRQFISHVRLDLQPRDVVVLFTDGITEAEDDRGRPFGMEGLCRVVRDHHLAPAEEIKDAVLAAVLRHVGDRKLYDDVTVLVVKKT
jgi:sigma-B regulation protein RsbU (phosphoserine phosphatase)